MVEQIQRQLRPDEFSTRFFDGLTQGQYLLRLCLDCFRASTPWAGVFMRPRQVCPFCMSGNLDWSPSTGRGTLFSFGIVHHTPDSSFAPDLPFNLALIALDENVLVQSTVVDCPHNELEIDMPLQVVFNHSRYSVPVFRRPVL